MKIRADFFRIRTNPRDDLGNKIEPEQQLMQRVIETDASVSMQGVNGQVGNIPTKITYDTTVGELASAMRSPCFQCKHFDRQAWLHLYRIWNDPTSDYEKRQQLNDIRAALLSTQNVTLQDAHISQEGDMDLEHALSVLGVCHPLSEKFNEAVIVYPNGTCPSEVCTPTQPLGFFDAKDKESERLGSTVFDRVMKVAAGKAL